MLEVPSVGNIQPQSVVSKKIKAVEQPEQQQTNGTSLASPDEVVGRSQVNFSGSLKPIKTLSAKELNTLAEIAPRMNLNASEVKVVKQAFVDTMNEYRCKSVEELTNRIGNSISDLEDPSMALEILGTFSGNISKIDSKADVLKLSNVINAF